jgi:hypothetical protein
MATQKMMAVPAKVMAAASILATLDDLTLTQIKDAINSLAQQGSTFQYQIGVMYNHIVNKKLAELAGFGSVQAYFNQHVKALSQSTLGNYGMVARNFTVETCTQYGMYRLRVLLRYLEAINATVPEEPGPVVIDVPRDDGTVVAKPFAECSMDEVERATRAKRSGPTARVPVADRARLLFLADSLHNQFEGVAEVRFTSRSQEGKTLISLQDVPMTELARLTQALQDGMAAEPTLAMPEKHADA